MSIYTIFQNITAAQTVSAISQHGGSNRAVDVPFPLGSSNPPSYQTWVLTVSTPQPGVSVSASAQPCGSNDGVNWVTINNPISAASAPNIALIALTTNLQFKYYGAYLTAISGAGATANMTISV